MMDRNNKDSGSAFNSVLTIIGCVLFALVFLLFTIDMFNGENGKEKNRRSLSMRNLSYVKNELPNSLVARLSLNEILMLLLMME